MFRLHGDNKRDIPLRCASVMSHHFQGFLQGCVDTDTDTKSIPILIPILKSIRGAMEHFISLFLLL